MACITTDFLTQRIAATQTQIIAYEDAVTALSTAGIQEYTLDTGQTVQKVSRFDIKDLQSTLDALYNRMATLCARRDGSGTTIGGPGF